MVLRKRHVEIAQLDHLFVLGQQLVRKCDVLLLGILLRGALQVSPSLPLVLALQIEHARLRCLVVAHSGLLVQAV